MTSSSGFPENFSLGYVFGECLICHEPSGTQLFCGDCKSKTVAEGRNRTFRRLTEMTSGQYAYVSSSDIVFEDGRYWIYSDAKVVNWPEETYTVKIRRSPNDNFVIDILTLDFSRLGPRKHGDDRSFILAILDTTVPESYALPPARNIMEMEEGDSSYIDPLGAVLYQGEIYVSGRALISKEPGNHHTLKVTRRQWHYEIDRSTIGEGDEFTVCRNTNNLILLPAKIV